MGWTIIKEAEWAKQFHVDNHFGTIEDDFGAQWRFVGMAMNAEAKMQAGFALNNLMNADGLIANSDGEIDWPGQWVMLEALSDVSNTLQQETMPHSASNRYLDPETSAMFLGGADMLFGALIGRQPADTAEYSLAVQGLTWCAAAADNADNKTQAVDMIGQFGDALAAVTPGNATESAQVIRGLIEAYRVAGNDAYLTAAADTFARLAADYDAKTGIFASQNAYSIDDVASIVSALNSLKLFGADAVEQAAVDEIFTQFFLNAVNLSGLQQSVPPVGIAKAEFEQNEPPIFYGYPSIPMPPMAGGDFGIAPVFASEVTWDGSSWTVSDGNFDSAGAMHASNEMIWFHNDEVNSFPEVQ